MKDAAESLGECCPLCNIVMEVSIGLADYHCADCHLVISLNELRDGMITREAQDRDRRFVHLQPVYLLGNGKVSHRDLGKFLGVCYSPTEDFMVGNIQVMLDRSQGGRPPFPVPGSPFVVISGVANFHLGEIARRPGAVPHPRTAREAYDPDFDPLAKTKRMLR